MELLTEHSFLLLLNLYTKLESNFVNFFKNELWHMNEQRSKEQVLAAWLLGSRVKIPLGAWMLVFVITCCVVLRR
jgi:hypothetical protein